MNTVFHPFLTVEKWRAMPQEKQILNIVSELTRTRQWLGKDEAFARQSLERAFELIDLTVEAGGFSAGFLRELLRFREILAEYYVGFKNDPNEFGDLVRSFLDMNPEVHNLGLEI